MAEIDISSYWFHSLGSRRVFALASAYISDKHMMAMLEVNTSQLQFLLLILPVAAVARP